MKLEAMSQLVHADSFECCPMGQGYAQKVQSWVDLAISAEAEEREACLPPFALRVLASASGSELKGNLPCVQPREPTRAASSICVARVEQCPPCATVVVKPRRALLPR